MQIIYEPKGKALEYSPLACNLYKGCPHGCRYCYGPTIPNPAKKGLTMDEWTRQWHSKSVVKKGAMANLERDCWQMHRRGDTRPVLLCFACDPYPPDEPPTMLYGPMTRRALGIMNDRGITPIILTKGGTRACRDFDILKAAGGWFGQTVALGCEYEQINKDWEPNAAALPDRYGAFQEARRREVKTWVSIEPVLFPDGTARAIWGLADSKVDHFKLGKLSGYDRETRAIEKSINWPEYREQAVAILLSAGYEQLTEPGVFEAGTFYVKSELKEA